MLKEPEKQEQKLYPLRKFSLPGIYSVAYLSQLVQRKKLKAKKIGRNYFTTREWFNEYLERHARDGKQHDYYNYLDKNNLKLAGLAAGKAYQGNKKINIIFRRLSLRMLAFASAFFILAIIGAWYLSIIQNKKGQVAGESEANSPSSSTQEIINLK